MCRRVKQMVESRLNMMNARALATSWQMENRKEGVEQEGPQRGDDIQLRVQNLKRNRLLKAMRKKFYCFVLFAIFPQTSSGL